VDACRLRINEIAGEKRNLDVGAASFCSNAIGEEKDTKYAVCQPGARQLPTADQGRAAVSTLSTFVSCLASAADAWKLHNLTGDVKNSVSVGARKPMTRRNNWGSWANRVGGNPRLNSGWGQICGESSAQWLGEHLRSPYCTYGNCGVTQTLVDSSFQYYY
jgi:hypothetical protein